MPHIENFTSLTTLKFIESELSDDSTDESASSWNANRRGTSSFACESLIDDSVHVNSIA